MSLWVRVHTNGWASEVWRGPGGYYHYRTYHVERVPDDFRNATRDAPSARQCAERAVPVHACRCEDWHPWQLRIARDRRRRSDGGIMRAAVRSGVGRRADTRSGTRDSRAVGRGGRHQLRDRANYSADAILTEPAGDDPRRREASSRSPRGQPRRLDGLESSPVRQVLIRQDVRPAQRGKASTAD